MSLPDQTPKLPKLPFLVGDVALLGAAWYLVYRDAGPLESNTVIAVTICVGVAAILGAVPFLTDYARKQDEALDERQRGLEALSRTINSAAEQISIAANGLNELTDLTHKNLKHAEQLPHKLQDKIAEFNAQLDNAREDDREELEKELAELRTSETERLQTTSEKVHKAIQELARLEASVQQHSGVRAADAERLQKSVTDAASAANAALTEAYHELARRLTETQARALAEIDRTLAERTALAVTAIEAAVRQATIATAAMPAQNAPAGLEAGEALPTPTHQEPVSDVASPPKRPRKARREEAAPSEQTAPEAASEPAPTNSGDAPSAAGAPVSESSTPTPSTGASIPPEPGLPPFLEPAPVPADAIVHIQPVAPLSAEPFPPATSSKEPTTPPVSPSDVPPVENATSAPTAPPAPPAGTTPAAEERAARKRAPRKTASDPNGDLQFELTSDDAPVTNSELVERVISSDGATRLIVTSYIGIGNRLFIRGEGPGLTWEKGVPLQFISIGKWRWETTESSAPIPYKLYKNDDVECPGLGTLTLDPGYQQEVTAKF